MLNQPIFDHARCHDPTRRLPSGMDSTHLTRQQADKLRADIRRQLAYLNKLAARMQALRWPLDDPVCREALRARDAVQSLYTAALGARQMDAGTRKS